jgi:hypothetical protein
MKINKINFRISVKYIFRNCFMSLEIKIIRFRVFCLLGLLYLIAILIIVRTEITLIRKERTVTKI